MFLLVGVVAFSYFAAAELRISNKALGQAEGTLDFCTKVDPGSADKYKKRGKSLVGNASEDELAKARSSEDYKDTYSSITTDLQQVPKEEAVKACSAFLQEK
jgi:hypothetical protein